MPQKKDVWYLKRSNCVSTSWDMAEPSLSAFRLSRKATNSCGKEGGGGGKGGQGEVEVEVEVEVEGGGCGNGILTCALIGESPNVFTSSSTLRSLATSSLHPLFLNS
jgi:hypothetical protein